MQTSIFIYGHGCYLPQQLPRNPNLNVYFNTQIDTCSVNDFTNPEFNENSFFQESRKDDYLISFSDDMTSPDINDFNSLGVYIKNSQGEINRIHEFNNTINNTLSSILKYLYDSKYISKVSRVNVYCAICRTACNMAGGKRRKHKSRKTKRRTHRKKSRKTRHRRR